MENRVCGRSSIGRASAFQAERCRFEPGRPLSDTMRHYVGSCLKATAGTRTPNLRFTKPLLCRLSYGGESCSAQLTACHTFVAVIWLPRRSAAARPPARVRQYAPIANQSAVCKAARRQPCSLWSASRPVKNRLNLRLHGDARRARPPYKGNRWVQERHVAKDESSTRRRRFCGAPVCIRRSRGTRQSGDPLSAPREAVQVRGGPRRRRSPEA